MKVFLALLLVVVVVVSLATVRRRGQLTADAPGTGDDVLRTPPRSPADSQIAAAASGSVFFRGGYATDPRDKGRPVRLIAAALKVPDQVFRDAFSGVRPALFGPPTASRARDNKQVLMEALGPRGVTNDRLDEVSDYYRYNRSRGEHWRYRPAQAEAVIIDGQVTGFRITDPGTGYTIPPEVVVAGHRSVKVQVELSFGTRFDANGSIKSLVVVNQ